jgi:hypothetical protein
LFAGTVTTKNMVQYSVRRKGRPKNFVAAQSINQEKIHFLGGWVGDGTAIPFKEYNGRMNGARYLR